LSPEPASRLPPVFKRLGWSNLFAQLSEQVTLAAAPLVAVLLFGATGAETGLLQTAQSLPFLLLSIPAGVLADRWSRRKLMAGAEALRAASVLGTLLLIVSGSLDLQLLAVLGFVGAVGTVAYSVAAPALVPLLVPREQLAAANRALELARSAAFSAGPAVGGAFVGWMGASSAYVLATTMSLLAVVLLAGIREPARALGPRRRLLHELREGAAFVGTHALLRPVLITSVFFNLAWFTFQAVYVVYAVDHLGLTATGVGVTLGVYGAGMATCALAAPWLATRLSFGAMVGCGPLGALVASALMLLTIRFPSLGLACVSFFLFGGGPMLWFISTMTLRQAVTPNPMLGRVSAILMTAGFGSRPVGAALGALVAARFGVEACLAVSAAGFAIQFVVLFMSPVRRLKALPA